MKKLKRALLIHRNKSVLSRSQWQKRSITRDNLAFFPELNVTLNRIKKSGNTSLFLFFYEYATGVEVPPEKVNQRKESRSICSFDLRDWPEVRQSKTIVCVRDPFTRTVSGFLQKVGRGVVKKYEGYGGYGDPSAAGFSQFLSTLEQRDWARINRHFWPQVKLLAQPVETFSCIARLESLSQDLGQFLSEIGLDGEAAKVLERPNISETLVQGKITNAQSRHDLLTIENRRRIEKLYTVDFDTFKYPRSADL